MSSITFEEVYSNAYVRESINAIMDNLVRQYPMLQRHDDDIRQRLWLILNRQLPQFNPEKCFIEGYARMTLNSAVKEIRRSYLSPRNLKKHSILHMSVPMDEDNGESPAWLDENAEREKFFASIREAVALLPLVQRRICAMFAGGASYPDIKRELRLSYKTLVKVHLPAIRAALRENIF